MKNREFYIRELSIIIENYRVENDRKGYLQFLIDKEYVDIRTEIILVDPSPNSLPLAESLDRCYRGIYFSRDKKTGQELYFLKQLRNMLKENKTPYDYSKFADQCFVALNKFKSK